MAAATASSTNESVSVLGIPISTVGVAATLEKLKLMVTSCEPNLVVTADATALVIAHDKPSFRDVLNRASLITADSAGVIWALGRLGKPGVERVSGVDLVERIVASSGVTGHRVYFLGAAPGVAEEAAARLREKYPCCLIVGCCDGYFPVEKDQEVAKAVAETKPDYLFVAMGMPRQEEFILATQETIRAPVAMGVGGSFDVFSGRTKRAPVVMQRMRLEWLWRLILNPKKIVKVKELPRFVLLVLRGGAG